MKRFFFSTILLFISIALVRYVIFSRFGIVLGIFTFAHLVYRKTWIQAFSAIGDLAWEIAYTIDLLGNILLQVVFNLILTKGNYYPYGEIGETISSATGKNKQQNTLNFLGNLFAQLLDFFLGKNHCIDSITIKIQ